METASLSFENVPYLGFYTYKGFETAKLRATDKLLHEQMFIFGTSFDVIRVMFVVG